MKNSVRTTVVFLFFAALAPEKASAQNLLEQINEAPLLTLNEFLTQTGKNTFFEEILIDTLDLKYSEVLALPAEDVVLGVKGAYQVLFPSESDSKPSHGLDSSGCSPIRERVSPPGCRLLPPEAADTLRSLFSKSPNRSLKTHSERPIA